MSPKTRTYATIRAMIPWDVLRNKRVLVVGGAQRLGALLVRSFASLGMEVSFSYYQSYEAARELETSLNVKGIRANLLSNSDLQRLITFATSYDIFIYNASLFEPEPQELMERFDDYVNIHMKAPLMLGMALGMQMKKRGWGRILYILDRTVVTGQVFKKKILYTATKHGLHGIAQALALELSPEVTVNSIAPGFSIPPTQMPPERVAALSKILPLERTVDPQELFEDLLHLIRSESKTGSTLVTDAGANLLTPF